MHSDTKLTFKDTDANTLSNPMSPRPESNARRQGPGSDQKSGNESFNFILLTRGIPGGSRRIIHVVCPTTKEAYGKINVFCQILKNTMRKSMFSVSFQHFRSTGSCTLCLSQQRLCFLSRGRNTFGC